MDKRDGELVVMSFRSARTDARGAFRLPDLAAGRLPDGRRRHAGHATMRPIKVDPGDDRPVTRLLAAPPVR
jgi:hypothetical protein